MGCFVGQTFYGAVVYDNDVTLLGLTPQAMRIMLGTCEELATKL